MKIAALLYKVGGIILSEALGWTVCFLSAVNSAFWGSAEEEWVVFVPCRGEEQKCVSVAGQKGRLLGPRLFLCTPN